MPSESKGKRSSHAIERQDRNTNSREATGHASASGKISLMKEAVDLAPCAELKQAATVALNIFETIQVYSLIDLLFQD
jgi:hypothetical protein